MVPSVNRTLSRNATASEIYFFANFSRFLLFTGEINRLLRAIRPFRLFFWSTLRTVYVDSGLLIISDTSDASSGTDIFGFLFTLRVIRCLSSMERMRFRPLPGLFGSLSPYRQLFMTVYTVEKCVQPYHRLLAWILPLLYKRTISFLEDKSVCFLLSSILLKFTQNLAQN